jgi:hypothetical protein
MPGKTGREGGAGGHFGISTPVEIAIPKAAFRNFNSILQQSAAPVIREAIKRDSLASVTAICLELLPM